MKQFLFIFIVLNFNLLISNEMQKKSNKCINHMGQILNDSLLQKSAEEVKGVSDCKDNFVLRNVETKANYLYNAKEFIVTEANYKVSARNVDIKMKAGLYIVLKPDTHIKKGALYLGKIETCSSCDLSFSYPKFFTPNGDGFNDFWTVTWNDYNDFSEVSIYDRYGKLIKILKDPNDYWNGNYISNYMNSSDYWFKLEYLDCNGIKKIYKSHFSLKR